MESKRRLVGILVALASSFDSLKHIVTIHYKFISNVPDNGDVSILKALNKAIPLQGRCCVAKSVNECLNDGVNQQ